VNYLRVQESYNGWWAREHWFRGFQ